MPNQLLRSAGPADEPARGGPVPVSRISVGKQESALARLRQTERRRQNTDPQNVSNLYASETIPSMRTHTVRIVYFFLFWRWREDGVKLVSFFLCVAGQFLKLADFRPRICIYFVAGSSPERLPYQYRRINLAKTRHLH